MRFTSIFGWATLLLGSAAAAQTVEKYDVFERTLTSTNSYANKFTDVTLTVTVNTPAGNRTVRGFYDGNGSGGQSGNVWKFRTMPLATGSHTWTASSNDSQLDGQSGSFTCVSSTSSNAFLKRGPIRIHPTNPHAIAHHDGTPFFWNGETEHFFLCHVTSKITQSQRLAALDFLQSKKVNNLLMTMVNSDAGWNTFPWVGTTPSNVDRNRFDLSRLRDWEQVVTYARDRGIVADLWFFSDDSGNLYPSANGSQEDLYFRYMIARFAAYANVTWNLALEYGEYRNSSWVNSRAQFFKNEDPYDSFLSVHDTPDNTWDFPGNPNLDHTSLQNFTNANTLNSVVINNRSSTASAGRPIPICHEEFSYEGSNNGNPTTLRQDAWAITCAGGFYKAGTLGFWIGTPYPQAVHFDHVKILYETVTKTSWWEMAPANGRVSSGGNGRFCLAKIAGSSSEFLVYSTSGSSFTLDLSGLSGTVDLEWTNPLNGQTSTATTTGGGVRTLNNPFGSGESAVWARSSSTSDTTPPSVSITNPSSDGQTVTGTIAVSGTASDASGISNVEYQIDSTTGAWTTASGTTSWSFSLDTNALSNGSHSIYVRATDGASNTSAPALRTINVSNVSDTTPPSVSITNPSSNGQTVSGTITVSGTASDASGVTLVEYQIDSTTGTWTPASGTLSWSLSLDTTTLSNGSHTIHVRATDGAAPTNTSSPVSRTINVSNVNQAPAANNQSVTTLEDTAVGIQLTYSDPDGPGPYTVTLVTPPSNGMLTGQGNDRIYTPNAGFVGTDTFTWQVNDGAANSNVATVTITVTAGTILPISNTSPASYSWGLLAVGATQYVDRTFTFTAVPAAYLGLDFLQTANDDKGSSGVPWITFDVAQDVTVTVAHDDRFGTKPSWMSGFVDTGDDLVSGGGTFSLWSMVFPAGTVTLGGNNDAGQYVNSMYSVVVGPASAPPTDTDGDGLSDAEEINVYGTDPALADTDGDGMDDGDEVLYSLDPLDGDQDGNTVPDGLDDWNGNGIDNQTDIANGINPGTPPAPGPGPGPAPSGQGGGSGGGCGATGIELLPFVVLHGLLRRARSRPGRRTR